MLMSSSNDAERRREERRREVRALSELGLTEISKASEGIHDTHRAISDRVFRIIRLGLGPTALPVKVIHDLITDGVYKTISVSTRAAGWASGKVADLPMEYAPSETWAFGAELAWERHEFRLDDQGPLPSGVVEERHVPVGVFARFSPNANIAIEANVGANTFSNLQIDSQAGVRVADEDIDPAIYAGFGVRVRF